MAVYQIAERAVEHGEAIAKAALEELQRAREADDWVNAWEDELELLDLPRWEYTNL